MVKSIIDRRLHSPGGEQMFINYFHWLFVLLNVGILKLFSRTAVLMSCAKGLLITFISMAFMQTSRQWSNCYFHFWPQSLALVFKRENIMPRKGLVVKMEEWHHLVIVPLILIYNNWCQFINWYFGDWLLTIVKWVGFCDLFQLVAVNNINWWLWVW